jgi:hypothetical protein
MDPVTQRVLMMLEDDTIGAPDPKPTVKADQDSLLVDTKDMPIGDVTGRYAAPSTGGGLESDAQGAKQVPPEAKPSKPNEMGDDLLKQTPNAMGRMSRMGMKFDV